MEEEYSDELNDTVGEITSRYLFAICPKPLDGEKEVLESYLSINDKGKIGKEKKLAIIDEHPQIFKRLDNLNQTTIKYRLREVVNYAPLPEETIALYSHYISLNRKLTEAKADVKEKITALTKSVVAKYPKLTEDEIKDMVINDKWHTAIVGGAINTAFSVSIDIEQQVIDLVDRYARRLSDIDASVREFESRVNSHLAKMGFEL